MMKKVGLTTLALLSIIFLYQCRKEKAEYSLQGKVTDARTGAGLNGAAVNVQKKVVSGSTYSGAYAAATNTTSDGAGNYSMTWERENFAALKVVASYPQFIQKEIELNVSNFSVGTPYQQNLALYPEAFIEMNITNILPSASADLLSFTFVNANFDCSCCKNGYRYFNGAIDTTFSCKLYGDQWLKYQSTFDLGGQDSVVVDSVWCPAFQTTAVTITY